MSLWLQEYMLIEYRLGKEIMLADGLSRLPNKKNKEVIDLDLKMNFVQFSIENLAQIRQATNADPSSSDLRDRILLGWPKTLRELHKNVKPY